MSVATGRTAASPTAPSSPPASRHHHRTPMNDTAITTARALFPRGLHQPQDSYRFGADALLLAAFAAESLASLPGTAPRKVAELGSGCGAALLGLCLYLSSGTAEMPEHCHQADALPRQCPGTQPSEAPSAAAGGQPVGEGRGGHNAPHLHALGPGAGHGLMRCGHGKRPPSGAGRCVPLPAGRPCRHAFFAGLRRKCLPSRPGQPALCADGQRPTLGQCPARRRPARPPPLCTTARTPASGGRPPSLARLIRWPCSAMRPGACCAITVCSAASSRRRTCPACSPHWSGASAAAASCPSAPAPEKPPNGCWCWRARTLPPNAGWKLPCPCHDGQDWSRGALAFCPWLGAGHEEKK